MTSRHLPSSLRTQAAMAIALVTAVAVGASFLALYQGMSSSLRAQLDRQLNIQAAEWRQFVGRADIATRAALHREAVRFIAAQRYHAETLLIAVQVRGGGVVSNHPDVVEREVARERGDPGLEGLLNARAGLTTATVAEAGRMRLLSVPIRPRQRLVGTLRLGESLLPVTQAQSSLLRTFAIVGSLALLIAAAVGVALAGLISAPLRRMTGVASAVASGDLSVRAGRVIRGGEVGLLSRAFDDMLERLQRTFARQREFVSDASHELRTPLSVLRAQIELLDREPDLERRHDATTLLLRRVDELDRLVSDMLTLASAEAGQLVEPQPIDLEDFFEDLRRDLPLFGDRDFRVEAAGGRLFGDPVRLTQVFRNLVRNAVAHTVPGDSIAIEARPRIDHLQISVRDTGEGIPPEELEHVFQRFRRVPGQAPSGLGADGSRGGGLGLPIARAIVEAHGGRIWAEPCLSGALIRIDLPGYHAPAPAGSAAGTMHV